MAADHRAAKGWHSRGYIPHFDSPETIQHIVFRTYGSLPKFLTEALSINPASRRTAVDGLLDRGEHGSTLLDPAAARIVEQALLSFDRIWYELLAWCVMPNHVHVVINSYESHPVSDLVRSWKTFTGREINRALGKVGPFWAPDYFDRFMRNEDHLAKTLQYVEANPVKAGLVAEATDWLFSSASRRQWL